MDKVALGVRILLGLIYFVFGLNGFLNFMTPPAPTPEAGAFLGALAATGYMFPVIKLVEVLAGIALLSGKFVPLALVISFPVTVNIFLIHAILDPGGLPIGIFLLGSSLFLGLKVYRDRFDGILSA